MGLQLVIAFIAFGIAVSSFVIAYSTYLQAEREHKETMERIKRRHEEWEERMKRWTGA